MHGQVSPKVIYRILKLNGEEGQTTNKQANKKTPKHKVSMKTGIFLQSQDTEETRLESRPREENQ